ASIRRRRRSSVDNQLVSKHYRAKYCLLFSVRFSVEPRQKQRAFGELASAGCVSPRKRLEADGRSWSTQLSHKRFGRIALSTFRIPTHIRRFRAADSARVLLLVGRSRYGTLRVCWQHRVARNVR